jgi:hypothetical protein
MAVVEDISLGYATVRLANRGARLTGLPVLGGAVVVGESVIVDYSGGTPPLVRPITTPYIDPTAELEGAPFGEGLDEIQSDVSFKVYADTERSVGTSYGQVQWDTVEFQTETFFSIGSPSVLTIPFDGYYFICANVGVQGFADWRSMIAGLQWGDEYTDDAIEDFKRKVGPQRVWGELRGSEGGTFGFNIEGSMDLDPSRVTTLNVHGMLPGIAGEEVSLWLRHTDPDVSTVDLKYVSGLYSRIWGFRMTHGGWTDAGGYAYGTVPGDDSDIEIQANMGYLHVSDEASQTYARGIAQVGDWSSLELTLDFRFEDVDHGAVLRLQLRSTRDWANWETPTRCYELSLNNTGGFGLHRVEGGSRTGIGSVNRGGSILDHKLRFRADGTNIKAKVWLASESEPGWDLEVSDAGGFTDPGGLQLGFFDTTGDHKLHIDNLYLDEP